jgi:hypothetical protein
MRGCCSITSHEVIRTVRKENGSILGSNLPSTPLDRPRGWWKLGCAGEARTAPAGRCERTQHSLDGGFAAVEIAFVCQVEGRSPSLGKGSYSPATLG